MGCQHGATSYDATHGVVRHRKFSADGENVTHGATVPITQKNRLCVLKTDNQLLQNVNDKCSVFNV